ncbi:COX15/CtaA family protein [Aequorivita echinoideorum]|uniref:COX15/CtaA family protein n=1 Tax=Aequorivita echinoideorum TaxID=1549647 RepID=A0ABS5S5I9_9FLAO|nr:COX15/CtaA family protein [Aequorivita echinoideorum]MBT0608482.1 COX15/CtaA family protein [Aequorivita echinoideorum]
MYRRFVKISLVLVYLVIIAGAMVRMTGSGMGCPDWPKCFGYYIPPTTATELEWEPGRNFKKGQVIIHEQALQVAKTDFKTSQSYNPSNWQPYTKHDYATFNVWHTWIEYINRLFGALAGVAIFIMALFSIKKWRTSNRVTLLSWLSVFLLGFQAWLGATVVYSVLDPIKITIHMVMALVIVAVLLYLLYFSKEHHEIYFASTKFKILLLVALILTLIQVVLGTQVREFVDTQIDIIGYTARSLWLENPTLEFYLHRSFSVIVVLINLLLWYLNRNKKFGFRKLNLLILLLFAEAFTGIAMYYFDFPFLSQPLHLILASLFFGLQFYILLEAFQSHNPNGTREPKSL